MIYVLLADGFEEMEALTPVDLLRRAGCQVRTVGMTGKTVTGSHGIPVTADLLPEQTEKTCDLVILPGGMPGAELLDRHPMTDRFLNGAAHLAAICAAPMVLGNRGLLKGKRAVCYPGFEDRLTGAQVMQEPVVTDGNVTTSRGAGTALPFALELLRLVAGQKEADRIAAGILYRV